MFYQINNIIGVDFELYEYFFMVDVDIFVEEDFLNCFVFVCVYNVKIVGICGEMSFENDEKFWWIMI